MTLLLGSWFCRSGPISDSPLGWTGPNHARCIGTYYLAGAGRRDCQCDCHKTGEQQSLEATS